MSKTSKLVPLALALAACTSTHRGVVNRYSGGEGQRDVQRVVNDPVRSAALKMEHIVHARQNGLLVVQFDLVNTRQGPLSFQWTIDWFDKAGLKIDHPTQHWTPERLPAGASKTIKATAPHPDATAWTLQTGSRDEVQ
jgi:uncharacterized protein YcfL